MKIDLDKYAVLASFPISDEDDFSHIAKDKETGMVVLLENTGVGYVLEVDKKLIMEDLDYRLKYYINKSHSVSEAIKQFKRASNLEVQKKLIRDQLSSLSFEELLDIAIDNMDEDILFDWEYK